MIAFRAAILGEPVHGAVGGRVVREVEIANGRGDRRREPEESQRTVLRRFVEVARAPVLDIKQ